MMPRVPADGTLLDTAAAPAAPLEEQLLQVAVVVPVHNVAPFLPLCLASIAAQSHQTLSCLMVDDGSTDGSADICAAFAARDPRFTLIRQPQKGVAAARAAGLAAAGEADFVTFCDADDLLHPGMAAALLHACLAEDLPVACCRFAPFTDVPAADQPAPESWEVLAAPAHLEALLHDHRVDYSLCNKLYRAGVLTPALLDSGYRYNEDLYANWQAFLPLPGVAFCDFVGYHYRQHAASASHRPLRPESIEQQREIAEKIWQSAADTPLAGSAAAFYYEKLAYLASMILRRANAAEYAPQLTALTATLRRGEHDPQLGKNPALPKSIQVAAFATIHCAGLYRLLCRCFLRDRQ